MIDLIESIGPIAGVVAFIAAAILAFLVFQQAREVRRLREWAGRAPERAAEAAEASLTAAEARGEAAKPEPPRRGRTGGWWGRLRGRMAPTLEAIDRRMPIDPRYLVAIGAAAVIAAAVVTSGFGLLGDGDGSAESSGNRAGKSRGGRGGGDGGSKRPQVTVLNATQVEAGDGTEIPGVQGLAAKVADQVVRPAGYRIAREDDAASGYEETVVMYEPGAAEEAEKLAARVSEQLGETKTAPMADEVRALAGPAPLVLVIGLDDDDF